MAEEPGLPLDSPGQIAGDEGPLDVEEGTTSEDQLLDWAEEVANQTEASGTHESLDVDVPDGTFVHDPFLDHLVTTNSAKR